MATESPRIAELRRRIESDPSSIAFAQLAEEYRRAGNYQAAEQCCRTGLERHPGYLSARVTLGRTLIELNQLEDARQELDVVLKAAPDNLAAIRGMAEIHQRLGRVDSALEYYRRALALARHDPELEEVVERLSRAPRAAPPPPVPASTPTPAPPPPPSPPSEILTFDDAPVDFDKLLDSLGITEHAAPPMVEALIEQSSVDGPQSSVLGPQSLIFSAEESSGLDAEASPLEPPRPAYPEPDWMVGPLPTISAPVEDASASAREDVNASYGGTSPAAPENRTAPAAPAAPVAPENRTGPDEPGAPDAPVAPEFESRERMILDELEAWLAAIKR